MDPRRGGSGVAWRDAAHQALDALQRLDARLREYAVGDGYVVEAAVDLACLLRLAARRGEPIYVTVVAVEELWAVIDGHCTSDPSLGEPPIETARIGCDAAIRALLETASSCGIESPGSGLDSPYP